jgi:subtilase family serine protease
LTATGFTVANIGAAAAAQFEVTVSGVGAFSFDSLAAQASSGRRFVSPCSRTVRSITAVADARQQVAESNERNNTLTVSC